MSDRLFKLADEESWDELKQALDLGEIELDEVNFHGVLHRSTPLHLACAHNAPLVLVQQLINKGANVHSRDEDDRTPLHLACINKASLEVIRALLDGGADALSKDKHGKSPLDEEHRPTEKEFLKHHASNNKVNNKSTLPPFFVELFAKARISDAAKQIEYARKLLKRGIDCADVLMAFTKEELKNLDIILGDATRLVDAVKGMTGDPQPTSHPKQIDLDPSKLTVMISYQWDSQPSALSVRDMLIKTERLNVIIDVECIRESFLSWMDWAVRSSDVFLLLATPKYSLSKNCEQEACRANALRKKIVPVSLVQGYAGEDWLAMIMAPLIRYDGSSAEALEKSVRTIMERELAGGVQNQI